LELSPYGPLDFFPFPWMDCVTFQGKRFNNFITNFYWNYVSLTLMTWRTYSFIHNMDIRCIFTRVNISLSNRLFKGYWIVKRMCILRWMLWKYDNASIFLDGFFPWLAFNISLNVPQVKIQIDLETCIYNF